MLTSQTGRVHIPGRQDPESKQANQVILNKGVCSYEKTDYSIMRDRSAAVRMEAEYFRAVAGRCDLRGRPDRPGRW